MYRKILKNLFFYLSLLNKVFAKRGPYRFVIKNWDRLEDVNLVQKIMNTEFFKDTIKPQPLLLEKFNNYLILAPHQDDESIGAGGLMLYLKDLNKKIDVVFTTDGAQHINGYTPQEVSELRNEEAQQALSFTGAAIHQIPVSNMSIKVKKEHIEQLSNLIEELKPDVILLPWLLDSPVKHRVTNHMLYLANKHKGVNSKIEIWSYQVHNTIYPNAYLDITSKIEEKKKMVEAYHSQNENFICYDHLVTGMNAWNSRFLTYKPQQVKRQFIELFFTLPVKDYLGLIERFYLPNIKEVYKGRPTLVKNMKETNNL